MSDTEEAPRPKPIIVRNAVDLQRMKIDKLMKNPEKEVIIPEHPKAREAPKVPEYVRNVMGSSAGAGSGEFHVYRNLRRKENARQKYMQYEKEKERLDNEFRQKVEENKKIAEDKTAKKRAKRQKQKERIKKRKLDNNKTEQSEEEQENAKGEDSV